MKMKGTKLIVSIVLFVLCAALLVSSVLGYSFRSTEKAESALESMSISAVVNAATDGLVDQIATNASGDKLKELRKRDDFRQMGTAAVKTACAEAEEAARQEAQAKYSITGEIDTAALEENIAVLKVALDAYNAVEAEEQAVYTTVYNDVIATVTDFSALVEGKEDADIEAALLEAVPSLKENPAYAAGFVQMARDKAEPVEEEAAEATEESAEEAEETTETTEETISEEDTLEEDTVEMKYFTLSEEGELLSQKADEAFEGVWAELVKITPDLDTLDKKTQSAIEETVMEVVSSAEGSFSDRYSAYAAQNAEKSLGDNAGYMKLASLAETLLIAFIALILFTIVYTWWKPLTTRMGVPRTIILLFFIYLFLAARMYGMNISNMMSNVLERVGMYGILVLAMMPSIQCGIGLNMGMTIGCVSGLFAIIVTLQLNMTGYPALIVGCVLGALVALPLGWLYSMLLNRMKGSEMTISTYVGYSFVSLMCIGWLLLPFYNPKIVFPLRGSGMRVTHSLLDVTAHLLDNLGKFTVFGVRIPTGILVVFLLLCLLMWLFSRSKVGVAMTAVGSNPRFAEASGINVNKMRTLGTVLSMMIAAVGIVIYSSAFGYAQLYNAPKQLGFITASAILIGGASVKKAKVSHVIIGVILFEGVLTLGQQVANAAVAGGGLSEVMRIMISNGIILYALTQSGGDLRG